MASPPFLVKAVYEYSSPHDDDLKFPVGQIINVTEEEGDDWYYGEYTDHSGSKQEGLFPRNFVKNFEPEPPPRPSRSSRSKKEIEKTAAKSGTGSTVEAGPAGASALDPEVKAVEEPESEKVPAVEQSTTATTASLATPQAATAVRSEPSSDSKSAPVPSSDPTGKPASGSFRDRINAFNKPAAPPVAPKKPTGLSSSGSSAFVKKAFVAPPPSKNAYVPIPREAPPQKVYRREEELEAEAEAQTTEEQEPPTFSGAQALSAPADEDDSQPKPTSLRERIALLQKQQMEQAARHADAAQRKEKVKKPSLKRNDSQDRIRENEDDPEDERLDKVISGDTTSQGPSDTTRVSTESRPYTSLRSESPDATPLVSPSGPSRDLMSDSNDADLSGAADTEEGEETLATRGPPRSDLGSVNRAPSNKLPRSSTVEKPADEEQAEADEDDGEAEEEEEIDPEVKKRREIRERMAKMSGGMGMAGMFGPPGAMAPMPPKRQVPSSGERKSSVGDRKSTGESTTSRAPPVPIMPMPGLTKVRSPEEDATPKAEISKDDDEQLPTSITQGRQPEDMPDVEDLKPEPVVPSRRSTDQSRSNPLPHERPVPPPPNQARGPPPPPPTERSRPPASSEQKITQVAPPGQILSPSEGSESDDELSERARQMSLRVSTSGDSRPTSRDGPTMMPPGGASNGPPPSLPSRPRVPPVGIPPQSPTSLAGSNEPSPSSPSTPSAFARRTSRAPPMPGSSPAVPPPTTQSRAPPPPPPTTSPPSRVPTGDMRAPPPVPKTSALNDSDEEVTEYEGDYDTDIAPGASHKAALKAHSKEPAKDSSLGISFGPDDSHESRLSSSGLAPAGPPRAIPPVPPPQPPRGHRQSSEIPRAAPPPPPVPPPKEPSSSSYDGEDDQYSRPGPNRPASSSTGHGYAREPTSPNDAEQDSLYSVTPPQPQRTFHQSPAVSSSQYASPPSLSAPNRPVPRQSLDTSRTSTSGRRSMEAPRSSSDQGFIATDIDLGPGSQWWTESNMPPPALQNRRDVIYEIEDQTTTRRGGRQAVTRNVYALYMDYSQTIIAAHFEARDPSDASLEQHHEPPPPRLRQDQLENAHTMFGTRIADGALSKKETVVGDGSPHALILELMSSLPSALRPVGTRAYGALVYTNLANASVQQFDEIRAGDIITFRNARFQGHKGAMHAKYSAEIGKQDHVGVVVDWDGTKKKIRAWEQGRE
ncbi:MAG: hypothetical protein Q9174_001131, partial [Haloplaca sp. 1 TL-2023]